MYAYYGDSVALDRVIDEVAPLPTGGTLAVFLAEHALRRGYDAAIYTYNLQMFDPTWFPASREALAERLEAQLDHKTDAKLRLATNAYLEFLGLGGEVLYRDLESSLLDELLADGGPVLTGLSATYLYGCARERDDKYDDVGGTPTGHFVVLSDYERDTRSIAIADPLHNNPRFQTQHYRVSADRAIAAILLGVMTYDANLLLIRPKR